MDPPRAGIPEGAAQPQGRRRRVTLLPIVMSLSVLAGVGVVAGLEMAVCAIGSLGSHAPASDTGTTLVASAALVALGGGATLAGRLIWGRGSLLRALGVAVAGVGPFLLGLTVRPKALLALVPSFEIGPHAPGTRLVGLIAVGLSVIGVSWAARKAATHYSG